MMTYKILIVDDELANLRLLERLFLRGFECLTASSGAEAIRLLEQHDVAILITDQRMPHMTGIDLLKHTARLRPHMVRILLTGYTDVEVLVDAINSGLVYMYVTKPWNNDDLKLKINRACEHYESNKKSNSLALANDRLLGRLQEIKLGVVTALSEMLRTRDEYAYGHALRVRDHAIAIAETMSVGEGDKEELSAAAMLHHLGDADIFTAATSGRRWSAVDQNAIVRAHSECEARLLASIPELGKVVDVIKSHRENFDGSGSPAGLVAERIPLASRILRVANEYELMIQPQASVASMTHDEAMRFLSQRSGKQFDTKVIAIMSQFKPLDVPDSAIVVAEEVTSFGTDDVEPGYVAVFS
jgi:response regulator RpfG family c-di-GMP phosphodiesterase